MPLHVETRGAGKPVVLLHGWGMHGGVWQDVAGPLAQALEVHTVDLPGHGHGARGALAEFTLDGVADALAARFPVPVTVVGWSLGGMIAQRWAVRAPETVAQLVLVASTPCFANRADWHNGMPADALALFAEELERDFATTLRRFAALQVRGAEGERETLTALRDRLFARGEPDPAALRGGLEILRDADLRPALGALAQPALVIAGGRDRLTPPQASRYMAQALPRARLVEIAGAAHAPFLSHRDAFVDALLEFMKV
ncbi:MAG TPA: pimeloyl-ACP methyl ester esterase BioH [Gallionellaceae bacterium]|nr:pimeloyl-ACP methyl ester esterase BioH [Gallionellaceae bacterium]